MKNTVKNLFENFANNQITNKASLEVKGGIIITEDTIVG